MKQIGMPHSSGNLTAYLKNLFLSLKKISLRFCVHVGNSKGSKL